MRPDSHIRSRLLNVLLLALLGAAPATRPDSPAAHIEWSVRFLASDECEGRGPDTQGINRAAGYVEGAFQGAGLVPPPEQNDYRQMFPITRIAGLTAESNLSSRDGRYKPEQDFGAISIPGETKLDAPVVFAGYGIVAKEKQFDEFAGLEVKGKIVLLLRYEPVDAKGASQFTKSADDWSRNATINSKAQLVAERGAAAVLLVNPPNPPQADELMSAQLRPLSIKPAIPVLHIKRRVAEDLLKRGGLPDLAKLQASIDDGLKPQSAALKDVTITGKVDVARVQTPLYNIIGLLPGHGSRADEYIIVGAHYDHIGYGAFASRYTGGKRIHPGADDNASGTAAVIELARQFAHAGPQARTIVFIAFSGEELGLLGSGYFAEHSPVPMKKVAAMVNLDMVGRLGEDTLYICGDATCRAFTPMVRDAAEAAGVKTKPMWSNGQAPSDVATFVRRGIPSLFLLTGPNNDAHSPADTADKINYAGEAQVVEIARRIVVDLCKAEKLEFTGATTRPATRP